jgi:hypothetical protein
MNERKGKIESGIADSAGLVELRTLAAELLVGLAPIRREARNSLRDYPIISVGDIQSDLAPPTSQLSRRALDLRPEDDRLFARPGDILVTARGTQWKVALMGTENAGALVTATLILVRPLRPALAGVIYAGLKSGYGTEMIHRRLRTSTSTLAWSVADVGSIPLPVPPAEIQDLVTDAIYASEAHYRISSEAADLRRQVVQKQIEEMLFAGVRISPINA